MSMYIVYCILYSTILSYQLKLIKMSAKLANLNHCAVSFLSRADSNLCWYDTDSIISDNILIVYNI